jgi:hypothetical protein
MGGVSWDDKKYTTRAKFREENKIEAFAYDASIRSGVVAAKTHEKLDPSKLKAGKREARDSEAHPNSSPIFVGLDVTGSMSQVPKMIQAKLPALMGLLTMKGYVADPAICVAGIGDAKYDRAPFQVGQFESGIEIEDDITNLYLEGGGGGNRHESYDLALFFLARCVVTDAWEKRGRRGYAFIICDEELPGVLPREEVEKVFGDKYGLEADVKVDDLVAEVLEKWELYCIVPKMTSHYSDDSYKVRWREKLGERVLMLDDPNGISELIASTIGILEENADVDSLVNDLTTAGVSAGTAESVTRALARVEPSGLSKVSGGDTGLATL